MWPPLVICGSTTVLQHRWEQFIYKLMELIQNLNATSRPSSDSTTFKHTDFSRLKTGETVPLKCFLPKEIFTFKGTVRRYFRVVKSVNKAMGSLIRNQRFTTKKSFSVTVLKLR
jgi:hypothetical protein